MLIKYLKKSFLINEGRFHIKNVNSKSKIPKMIKIYSKLEKFNSKLKKKIQNEFSAERLANSKVHSKRVGSRKVANSTLILKDFLFKSK